LVLRSNNNLYINTHNIFNQLTASTHNFMSNKIINIHITHDYYEELPGTGPYSSVG